MGKCRSVVIIFEIEISREKIFGVDVGKRNQIAQRIFCEFICLLSSLREYIFSKIEVLSVRKKFPAISRVPSDLFVGFFLAEEKTTREKTISE